MGTVATKKSRPGNKLSALGADVAGTLQAIAAAAVITIPGADDATITLATPGGTVTTPAASDPCRTCPLAAADQPRSPPFHRAGTAHLPQRRASYPDAAAAIHPSRRRVERPVDVVVAAVHAREEPGCVAPVRTATGQFRRSRRGHRVAVLRPRRRGFTRSAHRHHLDADAAFAVLVRASQTSNRELRDLAQVLTDTGETPI